MPTLIIKTNASQVTDVLIGDLGVVIPGSGGSVTFTNQDALHEISESRNLLVLTQDDAYGAGSSTLILNDGVTDVAQANVEAFLQTVPFPDAGPYALVIRDGNADPGLTASEIDYDDALTLLEETDVQGAIEALNAELGRFNDLTAVTNTTEQGVSAPFNGNPPPNDGLFDRDSFSVTASVDGLYRLDFSYTWAYNSTSSDFIARISLDNTEISFHRQEPQDAGGLLDGFGSNQRFLAAGFRLLNLSAGTYNITFSFGGSNGTNSFVDRSYFMFYRVSA